MKHLPLPRTVWGFVLVLSLAVLIAIGLPILAFVLLTIVSVHWTVAVTGLLGSIGLAGAVWLTKTPAARR